ncbi:MAG: M20 family metallopeptidase [Dysgonamonadaceae bacterium]|jgi:hippurate hydrolase|nr:M20 family metallopeptidase [Dysgonamonadaceae bacterium]MDD3308787.1 M20 family metallopeptidase [Dysgonamonadaceae bacterium]MDD3900475.1 M20 family metallopeptidase [Dysgonamonadaceae bacterium]MDD4398429.1 M20 family metallopeptidase [Dysgonamonadaceae bacterium]MEA5080079.1 M20 family metallopeptidase [Dysgonamonadaceae bacterium]
MSIDIEIGLMIQHFSETIYPEIVDHYRYLHQHPELSYQEKFSSEYITSFLDSEGISYRSRIGGYGILAWVKGEKPGTGNTIAFVADMDALPVKELNDVPYKSTNEGVMHACGHDSQVASMMGAVKIVNALRKEFCGNRLFVFQPGEELSPGGADLMIKAGVFDDYQPDFIVKQHAYIDLPAGQISFQSGTIMASADEVHIKVKGQGGHGALPHELNDTVLAASSVIVALQQVVSRRRNPFNPMVLSFGKFIADGATNVIPSEVTLAGSLRCMNEEERNKTLELIPEIIHNTVCAYGCTAEVIIPEGYPCTISHEEITKTISQKAIDFLGKSNVSEFPKRMTSEDFGFFTQLYPSCYYRFGISHSNFRSGPLHSGTFLIDEESLKTAVGMFSYIALS